MYSLWRAGSTPICRIPARPRARICKRLWSPGIDSEKSIAPAYVVWRAGPTNRVVVPDRQDENRFLGSLKGLQIRALVTNAGGIDSLDCCSA